MNREKAGRAGTVADDMDREQDESPMDDLSSEAPEREEPQDRAERQARPSRGPRSSGGGLRVYKPGQGYYTRIGTAIGAGILIVAGTMFLFNQIGGFDLGQHSLPIRYGLSVGFLVVMSVLTYWVVGLNRKTNDFFIATEGEMKKVSWSSRKDIIRSTKVVIATVVLMAVLLFVVDLAFMMFFRAIGVLKGGPGLFELFGGSKA